MQVHSILPGNLLPKYRSKLSSIYLVALVKSTFTSTYGMDAVLQPFIDFKKLVRLLLHAYFKIELNSAKEEGVEFNIQENSKIVYGILSIVSADNLGSLAVGGFKESRSSLKMCRHCMATKAESQKQVRK